MLSVKTVIIYHATDVYIRKYINLYFDSSHPLLLTTSVTLAQDLIAVSADVDTEVGDLGRETRCS